MSTNSLKSTAMQIRYEVQKPTFLKGIRVGAYNLRYILLKDKDLGIPFVISAKSISTYARWILNDTLFLSINYGYSLVLNVNKERQNSFEYDLNIKRLTISIDPFHKEYFIYKGQGSNKLKKESKKLIFLHEMVHARDFLSDPPRFLQNSHRSILNWTNPNEISAIQEVNKVRRELNRPETIYHRTVPIKYFSSICRSVICNEDIRLFNLLGLTSYIPKFKSELIPVVKNKLINLIDMM